MDERGRDGKGIERCVGCDVVKGRCFGEGGWGRN